MARLQLLDAGLLQESHNIMQMFFVSSSVGRKPGPEDDEGNDGEPSRVDLEPMEDKLARMDAFVKHAIRVASKRAAADNERKNSMVYEERRRVISEFYASASKHSRRCRRCRA